MQANSSVAEFLSTIFKFLKRMNFFIACLHASQNMKLGIFTGSRAVDGKEMYKKARCMCKVVVCLIKLLLIWLSRRCHILNLLLFMMHCYESKTEYSWGKLNCSRWKHPKRFFDSWLVPSFLVRKVENKSFPCKHKLGEQTGQVWRDNSRRVQTHKKNSGDTVRRLGTIIQSIFRAQSGAGIRLNVWK